MAESKTWLLLQRCVSVALIPVAFYSAVSGSEVLDLRPLTFSLVVFCLNSWWWGPIAGKAAWLFEIAIDAIDQLSINWSQGDTDIDTDIDTDSGIDA